MYSLKNFRLFLRLMLVPELIEGFPLMPYADLLIETRLTKQICLYPEGYFSRLSPVAGKTPPNRKNFKAAF